MIVIKPQVTTLTVVPVLISQVTIPNIDQLLVLKPQVQALNVLTTPTSKVTIPTELKSIGAFADILIINPIETQVLSYVGNKWINFTPPPPADANLLFIQSIASNTWSIPHNLSKFPSVTIVDSAGDEVEGDVHYINNQSLNIVFSASFSGKAYLN